MALVATRFSSQSPSTIAASKAAGGRAAGLMFGGSSLALGAPLALQAALGQEAQPLARHKQSTGLFVSRRASSASRPGRGTRCTRFARATQTPTPSQMWRRVSTRAGQEACGARRLSCAPPLSRPRPCRNPWWCLTRTTSGPGIADRSRRMQPAVGQTLAARDENNRWLNNRRLFPWATTSSSAKGCAGRVRRALAAPSSAGLVACACTHALAHLTRAAVRVARAKRVQRVSARRPQDRAAQGSSERQRGAAANKRRALPAQPFAASLAQVGTSLARLGASGASKGQVQRGKH
jgi:hypothetical protein